MYIYIYIYTHIHTHTYFEVCILEPLLILGHMQVVIYEVVGLATAPKCILQNRCVCVYVCVYVYIYIYIHTYIHTYII